MPYRSIAIRFQALLTSLFGVLFSFRSLYYYAIGLEVCSALEECVPRFPARFPAHGTQDPGHTLLLFRPRGYHPLRPPVPGESASQQPG